MDWEHAAPCRDLVCVCDFVAGLAPYNFICVQAGTVLNDLGSMQDALTPSVLLKLAVTAIAVVGVCFASKAYTHKSSR